MDKKLITKEYNQKIKLIKYYNQKYYDENTSEVSDKEYDNLKKKNIIT